MSVPFDPEPVLAELKDFQRRTAERVFGRMFDDTQPTSRFLVADEVGLGKTHVAKGVLALVLDHLHRIGDERHDIVYVCSNAAIAAQNLRKLVPKGITPRDSVRRLTMLPLTDLSNKPGELPVNLLAITPATSLEFGRSTGRFEERVLAYAFLRELWGGSAFPARARRIFWEGVNGSTGDQRLQALARDYRLRIRRHVGAFAEEVGHLDSHRRLRRQLTLREDFDALVADLAWQRSFPEHVKDRRRAFIADVRRALATVGIGLLDPDLVILDEFQRFKDLLDPDGDSWASQLANRLFAHVDPESGRPTRTLLLSATPYRMYTLADEEGEDHYADFLRTCQFLMDDPVRVASLELDFRALRNALTDPLTIGSAAPLCRNIERELSTVMARTERLAATPDRGGMLAEDDHTVGIDEVDLRAYVRLGDLAEEVDHHDPVEYWKSSPYLFNFMEAYKLKRGLEDAIAHGLLPEGERLDPGPGLLDWESLDAYGRIDPQNGRLRWLIDELDAHHAFDLLWIPPSLPYYETGSRYDDAGRAGLTKRLVFSGWAVVPKVVSSLLSHEAERRAFAEHATTYTADYSSRGGRRLDFRIEGNRPSAMTAFLFCWPSPTLAEFGDVRRRSRPGLTLVELAEDVRAELASAIAPFVAGASAVGAVDQRWYWAAPLLLDRQLHPAAIAGWFLRRKAAAWTDESAVGFTRHVEAAVRLLEGDGDPLGRMPEDLIEVLAELAIGSPAICALRSISAVAGLAIEAPGALDAAARVAWGFRSLFNAPEVTALVASGASEDVPYWRLATRHSADGNLQAVLDEHMHVLRDWLGFLNLDDSARRDEAAGEIAKKTAEALGIRTSSLRVDVPHVVGGEIALDERRMRTRFAVAFGNQRLEGGGEERVESISAAFNSPFWPFVLTSTSVGQEGLDFHLWCHGVVHWNLPSNPVDLEQREGRVHRFKGHAVRRNVAATLGAEVIDRSGDVWQSLFDLAVESRGVADSEMVPYWIYNSGPARIHRWAPVPPYSRDAALLPKLRRSLAAYRLAIGQPRQQELVEYLGETLGPDELTALLEDLRIDLTPQ